MNQGEVSPFFMVEKTQLGKNIGTLASKRIREILDGIKLVLEPRDVE